MYVMAISIYLGTRKNYRRREEHGSAKWGVASVINKKYMQKPISNNKVLIVNKNYKSYISLEDFINLYHSAISKAYEIASYGIEMNDFHKNNCTINDDFTIGIFDVDFYKNKVY